MRNLLFLLLFSFIAVQVSSQSKQDYYWPLERDDSSEPGIQATEFDFNDRPFMPTERLGGLIYDQQVLSQSDVEGNLLFTCNGCTVANAQGDTMLNGHGMHEGEFVEFFWSDRCDNLPGYQDLISLQDPGNPEGYYIIQQFIGVDLNSEFTLVRNRLNATYVDMAAEGGLGEVIYIDSLVAQGEYTGSYLTAIRHDNGQDWWILNRGDFFTRGWNTNLLTAEGMVAQPFQDVGTEFKFGIRSSGYARFSSDGQQFASFNQRDGLHLYDFDRSTGLLSNFRHMEYHPQDTFGFSCMEFSPNSRFIYVSDRDSLWQVDTWSEDMARTKVLLSVNTDPTTDYFVAKQGPDCRVYIRSNKGSTVHFINKPDELGLACDFRQDGFVLPYRFNIGGFPNFPRFRVDEEEKCDPTITSLFGETVWYRRDLTTYPNPVSDRLTIELPEAIGVGHLYVLDLKGQLMWEGETTSGQSVQSLDMSAYAEGTYSVEYVPKDNPERRVWTSRVVVLRE